MNTSLLPAVRIRKSAPLSGRDSRAIVHEHGDASLTLTGTASDLALLLYQRPTIGPVDRAGDPAALKEWYREFTSTDGLSAPERASSPSVSGPSSRSVLPTSR